MYLLQTTCAPSNNMSFPAPVSMIYAPAWTCNVMLTRVPRFVRRSLQPWSGMSLPTKVSLVILLIVGPSALSGEYLDRGYVSDLARQNFQEELTAVVRQIGADITVASEFANTEVRQMELDRLMANRPDLID